MQLSVQLAPIMEMCAPTPASTAIESATPLGEEAEEPLAVEEPQPYDEDDAMADMAALAAAAQDPRTARAEEPSFKTLPPEDVAPLMDTPTGESPVWCSRVGRAWGPGQCVRARSVGQGQRITGRPSPVGSPLPAAAPAHPGPPHLSSSPCLLTESCPSPPPPPPADDYDNWLTDADTAFMLVDPASASSYAARAGAEAVLSQAGDAVAADVAVLRGEAVGVANAAEGRLQRLLSSLDMSLEGERHVCVFVWKVCVCRAGGWLHGNGLRLGAVRQRCCATACGCICAQPPGLALSATLVWPQPGAQRFLPWLLISLQSWSRSWPPWAPPPATPRPRALGPTPRRLLLRPLCRTTHPSPAPPPAAPTPSSRRRTPCRRRPTSAAPPPWPQPWSACRSATWRSRAASWRWM